MLIVKNLPVLQKLANITEGKNLEKQIDDLRMKEKILQARNQPWRDDALKISQEVDERIKELKKKEAGILQEVVGPTTKALLEEMC